MNKKDMRIRKLNNNMYEVTVYTTYSKGIVSSIFNCNRIDRKAIKRIHKLLKRINKLKVSIAKSETNKRQQKLYKDITILVNNIMEEYAICI